MNKIIKAIIITILIVALSITINIYNKNKILYIRQLTEASLFFVEGDKKTEIDMTPEELKSLGKVINGPKETIVNKHRIKEEDRVFVLLAKDKNGVSYKYEFVIKSMMDMVINKWQYSPQNEDDYEHMGIWLLEAENMKELLELPMFKNYLVFIELVKPIIFSDDIIFEGSHQSENWQYKDYRSIWQDGSMEINASKEMNRTKVPYINLLNTKGAVEEYYALHDETGFLIEEGDKLPLRIELPDEENTYTLLIKNNYEKDEGGNPINNSSLTAYKGTVVSKYNIHYTPVKINTFPSEEACELVSIREVLEALNIPYGVDNESDVIVVDTTILSDERIMLPEKKLSTGKAEAYLLKIGNNKGMRIGYKDGDDYLVYLDQIVSDLNLEIVRDGSGEWIKRHENSLTIRNLEGAGNYCMKEAKKISAKVNGHIKYAMLDSNGYLLSGLEYDFITPFCQGYAIVGTYGEDDSIEEAYYVDNQLNYLLKEDGQPLQPKIEPERAPELYLIRNGIALAYFNGKYNYIDAGGNRLSQCDYEYAKPFENGMARIYSCDAHAGEEKIYINSFGERIKANENHCQLQQ